MRAFSGRKERKGGVVVRLDKGMPIMVGMAEQPTDKQPKSLLERMLKWRMVLHNISRCMVATGAEMRRPINYNST